MTRHLRSNLVVPHTKGIKGRKTTVWQEFRCRLEVINLVTAKVRKRHDTLFGDHVIEFKLADLNVEPAGFQEIAEANVRGCKCEDGTVSSSRHEEEADVLGQRSGGQNVHAGKIEPVGREPSFNGGPRGPRGLIGYIRAVRTLAMPLRGHAKRHRPV